MQENNTQEILEAIHLLAQHMDSRFDQVDQRFDSLEGRVGKLEVRMENMVTKKYLDEKSADFKSELVALSRKTNTKLSVLVERLVIEGSLHRAAADQILSLEPFPQ